MDRRRAAGVAVMVRATGLVEQQVPVDRGLHAVVHVAEDLARILHRAVLRAAARHAEAVLGLDQHLVRERFVRQAERVEMVAGVPVEADAPHALPHGRIAQRVAGALVDALLVVVPDDELHRDAVRVEHRAEMVADQLRFALRRIAAALPGLRRPRLVLHGHRGDLHALRRVALEIARDVFGPRRFPFVEQLAAGARAAVGFHPGRRAPRRGEQEQLRRSGDDILHHRQDVLAVLPEVEGLHLTVARLGVRILLCREIAAADVHAAELVAEPLLRVEQAQHLFLFVLRKLRVAVGRGLRQRAAEAQPGLPFSVPVNVQHFELGVDIRRHARQDLRLQLFVGRRNDHFRNSHRFQLLAKHFPHEKKPSDTSLA